MEQSIIVYSVNMKTPFIIRIQRHVTRGEAGGPELPTFLRGGIAPTFCNDVPNKTSAPHFEFASYELQYPCII